MTETWEELPASVWLDLLQNAHAEIKRLMEERQFLIAEQDALQSSLDRYRDAVESILDGTLPNYVKIANWRFCVTHSEPVFRMYHAHKNLDCYVVPFYVTDNEENK